MKSFKFLFVCFTVFQIFGVQGDYVPKNWIVNLDLPPAQRWPLDEMLPIYNQSLINALGMLNDFFPSWLQPILEEAAIQVLPHLGSYADEITAGANKLGVPLGTATLLNIVYEAAAACTSIIAQDSHGNIYHGRNLDWDLADILRDLTITVEFQKGGSTLYKGVTFAGYFGLLTGVRPGGFSITANERDSGNLMENYLEALLVPGTYASCFLIRDTLEQETSFADAIERLAKTSIASPMYYIVAGTQSLEGAVLTRDRSGIADIWMLNASLPTPGPNDRWFEVETNFDHWGPAGDDRRSIAVNGMQSIGFEKITLDGIFSVLSTPDVLNGDTTYTALMSPAQGTLSAVVRS